MLFQLNPFWRLRVYIEIIRLQVRINTQQRLMLIKLLDHVSELQLSDIYLNNNV